MSHLTCVRCCWQVAWSRRLLWPGLVTKRSGKCLNQHFQHFAARKKAGPKKPERPLPPTRHSVSYKRRTGNSEGRENVFSEAPFLLLAGVITYQFQDERHLAAYKGALQRADSFVRLAHFTSRALDRARALSLFISPPSSLGRPRRLRAQLMPIIRMPASMAASALSRSPFLRSRSARCMCSRTDSSWSAVTRH